MHKIEGKKHRSQSSKGGATGGLFCKEIQKGNHGNAKEGAHDSPTEGIHPKECNSCGDDDFSQRRMGVFVGGDSM